MSQVLNIYNSANPHQIYTHECNKLYSFNLIFGEKEKAQKRTGKEDVEIEISLKRAFGEKKTSSDCWKQSIHKKTEGKK